MSRLRLASAADAAPNPKWLANVDELADTLKTRGVGCFCIIVGESNMEIYAAGELDPDCVAGYAARVLASMANEA